MASHEVHVGMKDGVSNGQKFLNRTNIQRNEVLKSDFFVGPSISTVLSSRERRRSKTGSRVLVVVVVVVVVVWRQSANEGQNRS